MHCFLRRSFAFAFALLAADCGSSSSTSMNAPADGATASDGGAPDLATADLAPVGTQPDTAGATVADGGVPADDGAIVDAPPTLALDGPLDQPPFAFPDVPRRDVIGFGNDRPTFETIPPLDAPTAPPPSTDLSLLVPGRARLVGSHFTACTNAPGATTDRWCAFSLPNHQIGLTDLWVINVTKALAGTPPKCDGSDPNCKLLIPPGSSAAMGTQLWTGQPMQGPIFPTTDRFDGDTLIFHALAPDNLDQYAGPIFAWRPGWVAPKQISVGKNAYSCTGHPTAETFVCIEDLTTTDPLAFNLTAGTLGAGAKLVKQIVPFRAGTQTSQWRANLTRDGQSLLFSTGGLTLADRETLFVVNLTTPDVATVFGTPGISRWALSADNKRVYYLRNYNYDTSGAPAGNMTMADFPSGANEVTLAPQVGAIVPLSDPTGLIDKGVAFFQNALAGKSSFKVMADPTTKQTISVVNNIGGTLGISRDLALLYYYKDVNMDNGTTTDGYVARMDGSDVTTGGCTLTAQLNSDQFGTPFTANGSIVMWADNIDQIDGVGEGWTANPNGCTNRRKFADKIDFWFLHASDGMLFSDQGMADFSTLEAMTFPGGTSLGTPIVVQPQVNRIYAILPDFKAVLMTIVASPPDRDGIYVYTKLPF